MRVIQVDTELVVAMISITWFSHQMYPSLGGGGGSVEGLHSMHWPPLSQGWALTEEVHGPPGLVNIKIYEPSPI